MTPSMSELPRAFVCPASVVLRRREYTNTFSTNGVGHHAEMEAAIIAKEWHKLPPEVAALLAEYNERDIWPEFTLFYDFMANTARTDKHRANRVERYASALPFEIPGTADVVAIDRKRRRGLVVDWKEFEEVGAAVVNMQTTGYAIALARLFDLDEVTVCIAYLGRGTPVVDIAVLDGPDFDAWRVQLNALGLRIAAAQRSPLEHVKVSRACRWCPAFDACPLQRKLEAELGSDAAITKYEGVSLDDDAAAAEVYDFVQRVQTLVKRTCDSLYTRAARRPIPLNTGKWLGRVERGGDLELTGDTVYDVARALYGQEFADLAVQRSATQVGIDAAAKTKGLPMAPTKRAILARVAELGGSKRTPKVEIDVVDRAKLIATPPHVVAEADALLAGAP